MRIIKIIKYIIIKENTKIKILEKTNNKLISKSGYIPIGPFDKPPQINPYIIKYPFGQK
jgi:hypothetical protein